MALTVYEDVEITSDILNGCKFSHADPFSSFIADSPLRTDAELIYQYREMIIDMMLKPVSIAGDNATGEEYEERAILQEKLEVYIEVSSSSSASQYP